MNFKIQGSFEWALEICLGFEVTNSMEFLKSRVDKELKLLVGLEKNPEFVRMVNILTSSLFQFAYTRNKIRY